MNAGWKYIFADIICLIFCVKLFLQKSVSKKKMRKKMEQKQSTFFLLITKSSRAYISRLFFLYKIYFTFISWIFNTFFQFHQTLLTYMHDKVWNFYFYVANDWPEVPVCLHFPGMTLTVSKTKKFPFFAKNFFSRF